MAKIQSYGATEVVTGSCHVLQLKDGRHIMIDCGMFQGRAEERNLEPFGFDPADIDILLITHGHLDHVGRIPKLVKEGFKGEIITLRSTMDLAEVVLLDSAKLMDIDYQTRYRKAQRRGMEQSIRPPLYTLDDVNALYQLPMHFVHYEEKLELKNGLSVMFKNAGHILDSAIIQITFEENGVEKTVVFSGDLGNNNDIVMPLPQTFDEADVLYIESTYGDRNHRGIQESLVEFKTIITETLKKDGNVVIPSFAIDRAQEILCTLKQMYDDGELPECHIYLDSPMAIRATELYNTYHDELSQHCQDNLLRDGSVFGFPYLHYTLEAEESMKINEKKSRCIIIAGSGMCNGGRVLHHFKHRLWDEKNALIIVGYQAEGTLGRLLVDGAKEIKVYGEEVCIKAHVHTINGFSAHADQKELIHWIRTFKRLGKIFIVHGERQKQEIFQKAIEEQLGKKSHIVKAGEEIGV
ncbi:MBL fold metallo-hydrolase [Sulfurospirillum sp. 1612]|uniref:MBL fold metallo-hydrolase n=1 Tax=Sulfurospirillum sp. 1612 TaxID=3094835 RepID=UPI002F958ADE